MIAVAAALHIAQYAVADTGGALLSEILGRQHECSTPLLDLGNDDCVTLSTRAHRHHLVNPQGRRHCQAGLSDGTPGDSCCGKQGKNQKNQSHRNSWSVCGKV
ncbi:hypothetical protein [Acidovorax sp. SD340]|uniref:hypothetical protein n=1 Tax=Acidovorax sp. SD340 TaxID=1690268 RepID=UPI001A97731C|nr:hypothetical protein [Acidovorax sp. SD340]